MAEPKKVVYGVGVHDDKCKRKAMKAISSLEGIQSIDMNMKDKKLTIVGVVNPVCGYKKLTKADVFRACHILSKGGLNDDNILEFIYNDIATHEENKYDGRIYRYCKGDDVYPVS
ncbi:unnamed protein product [Lactuca virosa]|uniref:HMA domain-containing protein n=1 Tax=Lactuca virosa TaxID=75947 RepID=A0AAU9LIV2_9ASTR|nr:unnamed protein product [Lactuca virosa]